jgi:hypothetical protein
MSCQKDNDLFSAVDMTDYTRRKVLVGSEVLTTKCPDGREDLKGLKITSAATGT